MKITFLGGGNMASALIGGLLNRGFPSADIAVIEMVAESRARLEKDYRVRCYDMPDAAAALAVEGMHWHDYGKQPRAGRKVGHATLRADSPAALADTLRQAGEALGRQAQVAPVIAVL